MLIRLFALFAAVVVLAVGAGAVVYVAQSGSPASAGANLLDLVYGQPVSAASRQIHVVIQPGEDASTIGAQLQQAGVIRSALAFRLIVRFRGRGPHLVAGDYSLRPNQSLDDVISALAQGRMSGGMLTIPEGWRALQVADALAADNVTSRADFVTAVDERQVTLPPALQSLPAGASLEGFLFPDSYRFEPGTPAPAVAQQMVDDFGRQLTPDLTGGFSAHGLSLVQAVTLASIVEREARVPAERPIIASVYYNRLQRGMKLEADPTVQYALIEPNVPLPSGGYWKAGLTYADLANPSLYNTYRVGGLPPGPICNPGLASLQAVAHPATTGYLYFVAKPDGTHAFAETFDQQQQNVAKYQGQS